MEEAVSRVLEISRARVAWLKRSLRTKDPREANIKAKPLLMEFDRILASAATYLRQRPLVTQLGEIEIERLAAYQYASMLEEDEEVRRDGRNQPEVHYTPQTDTVSFTARLPGFDNWRMNISEATRALTAAKWDVHCVTGSSMTIQNLLSFGSSSPTARCGGRTKSARN